LQQFKLTTTVISPSPDACSASIYKDLYIPEWKDAINAYIVLEGRYRFRDDPEWGEILGRMHGGCPLPPDFRRINGRVIRRDGLYTEDGDRVPVFGAMIDQRDGSVS
jgi:hypothetical protein